jgi:hypothetical protein
MREANKVIQLDDPTALHYNMNKWIIRHLAVFFVTGSDFRRMC